MSPRADKQTSLMKFSDIVSTLVSSKDLKVPSASTLSLPLSVTNKFKIIAKAPSNKQEMVKEENIQPEIVQSPEPTAVSCELSTSKPGSAGNVTSNTVDGVKPDVMKKSASNEVNVRIYTNRL